MTRRKMGRNDPCWCGSGKKYKKCHLDREEQRGLPHWEISRSLRASLRKRECMCPDEFKHECKGKIAQAHTVPKSAGLRQIAQHGHVYHMNPDFSALTTHGGKITLELVGVNQASTFSGFCQYHDSYLFRPIEQGQFRCIQEHCFLVGYRAVCREVYTSLAQDGNLPLLREMDRGRALSVQKHIQRLARDFEIGSRKGLEDIAWCKQQYDLRLVSHSYEDVMFYCMELDNIPGVLALGGLFPEVAFDGRQLQDLGDTSMRAEAVHFGLFASGGRGLTVFTWLKDSSHVVLPFIRSLDDLKSDRRSDAIIRFLFEFCENIYIAPEWWDGLGRERQQLLLQKFRRATDPFALRDPNCLVDDGRIYSDWTCKAVHCSEAVRRV